MQRNKNAWSIYRRDEQKLFLRKHRRFTIQRLYIQYFKYAEELKRKIIDKELKKTKRMMSQEVRI